MEDYKNYFVIGEAITINPGQRVKLTDDQVKRRKYVAKPIKKDSDIYEAVIPFQFKKGEIYGYAGDVNSKLLKNVVDPEKIEPAPMPEKEEEKKDFNPFEFLDDMSKGQLKYYARTKCGGMKLTKDMDIEKMIDDIKKWKPKNSKK